MQSIAYVSMSLRGNRGSGRVLGHAQRLCLVALFAGLAFDAAAPAAHTAARAEGSGQQNQQSADIPPQCVLCHDSDLITQQKLSRAAWSRELDKMIKWGAVVATDERERVLDALATAFGPARSARQEQAAERVEELPRVVTRSCLTCHERDLIAQQRLTRAGWVREVEKMIRWGAPVNEAEKSVLVDFLADRYPVR
jgi:cytochrome c553